MNIQWIEIKCTKCGKVSNYLKTASGMIPCDNPRCHKLLKVGKLTKEDQIKLALERR